MARGIRARISALLFARHGRNAACFAQAAQVSQKISAFFCYIGKIMSEWQPMETAPKTEQILVRRHNDIDFEYFVVWWAPSADGDPYPWRGEYTAYPTDRLDAWLRIPD